jgi:hypothetical protein
VKCICTVTDCSWTCLCLLLLLSRFAATVSRNRDGLKRARHHTNRKNTLPHVANRQPRGRGVAWRGGIRKVGPHPAILDILPGLYARVRRCQHHLRMAASSSYPGTSSVNMDESGQCLHSMPPNVERYPDRSPSEASSKPVSSTVTTRGSAR